MKKLLIGFSLLACGCSTIAIIPQPSNIVVSTKAAVGINLEAGLGP